MKWNVFKGSVQHWPDSSIFQLWSKTFTFPPSPSPSSLSSFRCPALNVTILLFCFYYYTARTGYKYLLNGNHIHMNIMMLWCNWCMYCITIGDLQHHSVITRNTFITWLPTTTLIVFFFIAHMRTSSWWILWWWWWNLHLIMCIYKIKSIYYHLSTNDTQF